ncbi:MAG: S-layer homology domain-containing protein, partial [Clostridia bacterium]|nr:S-layer homology domain-containing protein [Clostridia bacterium]
YKGMTIENSKDISEFPDASKVSTYAVENLKWAYGDGIVNGSKSGDKLYLNPRNPATRAECATMFSKYLYLEPVYEINGNDISLYTIVYNANEIESVAEAANDLAKYIEMSIGYKLPVVTDSAEVGEYEILVGKTNREEKGIVSVDRAAFTDDQNFLCQVQGNYLVITGIDTDAGRDDGSRTTFNIDGSQNAVIYFLEKEFGLNFYYKDEGTYAEADPVISLNDGYEYIDGPSFETRTLYIHSAGDDSYLDCGYYYSDWGCGLPHQLGNLMTGAWYTPMRIPGTHPVFPLPKTSRAFLRT